jgi:hypothetical protein
MVGEWLAALEATALAEALRGSVLAYPLINTAHVLGVALLVGAIVPLDFRLLGFWRSLPVAPLWRVLTHTAAAGLVLAILFGTLLFISRATEYAASALFIYKMIAVGTGTINALALRTFKPEDLSSTNSMPPWRIRLAAGLSLVCWLAAIILGRLVGYF